MDSYPQLAAAVARVERLRWQYAAAVFCRGVLAGLLAVWCAVDLGIAATLAVEEAALVAPLVRASIGVMAVLIAIYMVAIPLVRRFPVMRFVRYLDFLAGGDEHLLTALEVRQELSRGGGDRLSAALVAQVGERAFRRVSALSWTGLPAARRLYLLAVCFLALTAGGLTAILAFPEVVGPAVVLFVASDPEQREAVWEEAGEPAAGGPAMRRGRGLGCTAVRVLLVPPRYTGLPAMEVPWGGKASVAAGATLEVACRTRAGGLSLAAEGSGAAVAFAQESAGAGGGEAAAMVARVVVNASARYAIRSGSPGFVQPGGVEAEVVPDEAPTCALLLPREGTSVRGTDTLLVLARAEDDYGMAALRLRFRVAGLDQTWQTLELAGPQGERSVTAQRALPVTVFGADPGDRVVLSLEVEDNNNVSGPGRCLGGEREVLVWSPNEELEGVVLALAGVRNQAVDLLGDLLAVGEGEVKGEAGEALRGAVEEFAQRLSELERRMAGVSVVKQEDWRRVEALGAALREVLSGADGARPRELVAGATRELEQDVLVLSDLADKLLGEHLFYLSGMLQQELGKVTAANREVPQVPGRGMAVRRGLAKVKRLAGKVARLEGEVRAPLPRLFTPEAGEGGRFGEVMRLAGEMLAAGSDEEVGRGLDELSRAVEGAARSVEGVLARSMSRLSSSFRSAQLDMVERVKRGAAAVAETKKGMESLLAAVAEETRTYVKQRKTIAAVQEIARMVQKLSGAAARLHPALYPAVDRAQVTELRERLKRLKELVGLMRIEEACPVAKEVRMVAEALEFSLALVMRYGEDEKVLKKCREEQVRVVEARKLAEAVEAKLELVRPQRTKLSSLDSEALAGLKAGLGKLRREAEGIRERFDVLVKTFPIFFGRLAPAVERLAETVAEAAGKLDALELEESYRLVQYADESLGRLLDALQYSVKDAKEAGALGPGGSQPELPVEGKETVVSKEGLAKYLELSASFSEERGWQELIGAYFSLIAR